MSTKETLKGKKFVYCLILLWFSMMAFVFVPVLMRPTLLFDEDGLFSAYDNNNQKKSIVEEVSSLIQQKNLGSNLAIVHFNSPDCVCNDITNAHIKDLNQKSSNKNYKSYVITTSQSNARQLSSEHFSSNQFSDNIISLKSMTELNWLPALPAVMILSKGKLAYLGPYSSGAFCGAGNSYVEAIFKMIKNNSEPSMLNGFDRGCYCKNV